MGTKRQLLHRISRLGWRGQMTLVAPAAAAVAAAVTVSALGGFSANITQNGTFTGGSIVLRESGSSANCYSAGVSSGAIVGGNSYTCATIDAFGGPTGQLPGGTPNTQTLTFTNVGSSNASSFTLTPSGCAASAGGTFYGGDTSAAFCGKVDVTVGNGASVCYFPPQSSACPVPSSSDTLTGLGSGGSIAIGSGLNAAASATVVVSTELDPSAAGSDMGLEATQGLAWTLNQ
jgi:hypothetical protein